MNGNLIDLDRWNNSRFEVLERDSFKCKECNYKERKGVPQGRSKLTVHHIVPKIDLKLDSGQYSDEVYCVKNLLTLCKDCHKKKHKKERRLSTNPLYNRKLRHRLQKQYRPDRKIILTMMEILTLLSWLYGGLF